MAITIGTHLGTKFSIKHDLRDPAFIQKENEAWAKKHNGESRIDLKKEHIVVVDNGSLGTNYHRLFDKAVETFNEKQVKNGHPERQIKNYLQEIYAKEQDSKNAKHPAYELITTLGSMEQKMPEAVAKAILLENARTWEERNPNLKIVCQVIHLDERGASHMHTLFIPVAYHQKTGMETKNALSTALRQQGIASQGKKLTEQILWEKKENEYLEKQCRKYGYEVEHPKRNDNLSVENYILKKQLEEKQKELEKLTTLPGGTSIIKKGRLEQLEETEKKYQEAIPQIQESRRTMKAATGAMSVYLSKVEEFEKEKQNFEQIVNEAANKKVDAMKNKAFDFIKSLGLWDRFLKFTEAVVEKLGASMGGIK